LCYPYKVSWMCSDETGTAPAQIVFSVSKKRFKRAVDRNLVKRLTREAYRLHKQLYLYDLLDASGKKIVLSLSYIGKEIGTYDFVEKKMLKLLKQLGAELAK